MGLAIGLKISLQHQWLMPLKRRRVQRLIVVLHGRGDSLKPFQSIQEELGLFDHTFLLLQGPRKFQNGFSWCAVEPNEKKSLELICEKLKEIVSELVRAGWPPSRIFLLGFSQGAMVASHFAMRSRLKFGGVVGVSGYFFFDPLAKRQRLNAVARTIPWLMTHGRQDEVIPIQETRKDVSRMKRLGLRVKLREFQKGHHFEERREIPAIKNWILSRRPSSNGP